MKGLKKNKKAVVAMSGGIDSSVAAALLKKTDFNIIGVFMRFWMASEKNGLIGTWDRCCSLEAENRARKVAQILNIPFYVFNFEKEFKRKVVNYFLDGYKNGITPNPCVVCNKEIKFGLLLKKALILGTDFVATGHYARLKNYYLKKNPGGEKVKWKLFRAKDKEKDQSYFLWKLNQKQLKHILFPIGNYTRDEVRALAKKFKLSFLLDIPKSMEICFIPNADLAGFLKTQIRSDKGKIISIDGQIVGEHEGLHFYTIGQRKGIGFSKGPYFVLDKDLKNNSLIVTKNKEDLYKKELIAKNVNWISGKKPKLPLIVKSEIRYHQLPVVTKVIDDKKSKVYRLKFKSAQRAVTPGQSVVFYKNNEVLGGGIISS